MCVLTEIAPRYLRHLSVRLNHIVWEIIVTVGATSSGHVDTHKKDENGEHHCEQVREGLLSYKQWISWSQFYQP